MRRLRRIYLSIAITCLALLCLTPRTEAQNVQHTQDKADQALRSDLRVDPSTLGMSISIPLGNLPGRGISLPITLNYSSKLWRLDFHNYGLSAPGTNDMPVSDKYQTNTDPKFAEYSASGWTSSLATPIIEYTGENHFFDSVGNGTCQDCPRVDATQVRLYMARINVHLADGSSHELRKDDLLHAFNETTQLYDWSGKFYAVDGSRLVFDGDTQTLWLPDGSFYQFGPKQDAKRFATQYTDRNGNFITFASASAGYPNGYWTDTLGRTVGLPVPSSAPATAGDQQYNLPGMTGSYVFHWRVLKNQQTGESVLTNPSQNLAHQSMQGCDGGSVFYDSYLFTNYDNTFVCSDPDPFNPVVLAGIDLPTGQSYQFSYNIYGEIEKVKLPTGGYEQFTYGQVPPLAYITAPYNQTNRGVLHHDISADGLGDDLAHWQYEVTGGPYKVKETAPDGTYTLRSLHPGLRPPNVDTRFGFDDAKAGMAYDEASYSAAGVLLRRTLTVWSETEETHQYGGASVTSTRNPVVSKSITLIVGAVGSALTSTVTMAHDDDLNTTNTSHYAYISVDAATAHAADGLALPGSIPQGTLLKSEEATYLVNDEAIDATTRSSYRARNLTALPTSTRIKDGANTIVAQNSIAYDEISYLLNDYTNVPGWNNPGEVRGNPTSTGSWLDTAGAYLTTHSKYDQCGNVRSTQDAKGNLSQMEYDAAYARAYPTRSITPVPDATGEHGSQASFITTSTYDLATGRVLSTTDANLQTTTFEYAQTDVLGATNPFGRLTKVTRPNGGGWSAFAYGDQPGNLFVMTRMAQDAAHNLDAYQYADGLGRPTRMAQSEGAGSYIYTQIEYDLMGRAYRSSNPYRAGQSRLWTTTDYDEFGRVRNVTMPDGAQVQSSYGISTSGTLGEAVTVQDEAGKSRKSLTDSLGRLVQVIEDPEGLSYQTSYAYDALSNLRTIMQGLQTRTFSYDSLSRLTSAFNPESGTVTYKYDANGNLVLKIDPRLRAGSTTLSNCTISYTDNHVATCYEYDSLNRVKSRSYNDGTPNVSYLYDSLANGKGRLSSIASSVSVTSYDSYDQMGQVTASTQTTNSQSYTMAYAYDLVGHLISEVYPSGRTVTTAYDSAGRLQSINGEQTGESTKSYLDSFSYWPSGAIKDERLGNGLWEHTELNNRLQPTEIRLGTTQSGINRLQLSYSYETLNGGQSNHNNNGNVLSQSINVPQVGSNAGFSSTQSYQYDAVNRLTSAEELSGTTQLWKQSYTYADQSNQNSQYGNRRIDVANTTANVLPSSNPSINPQNNRFDAGQGYSYDEAGNVTAAPNQTFTYDAQNKQVSYNGGNPLVNNGASYSYDGDGKRIKKLDSTGTTIYVYDVEGKMVAEYSNVQANVDTDKTSYLTSDNLGSARIITGSAGQVKSRHDYLPFGEELPANTASEAAVRTEGEGYVYGIANGKDKLNQKFTGKERDSESGLDYFEARYYSPTQGRFTSPDEFTGGPDELFEFADIAARNPTFYAEITRPQSLNKYQYAYNSPLKFIDPSGHQPVVEQVLEHPDQAAAGVAETVTAIGAGAAALYTAAKNVDWNKVGNTLYDVFKGSGPGCLAGVDCQPVRMLDQSREQNSSANQNNNTEEQNSNTNEGEFKPKEGRDTENETPRQAQREAKRRSGIPTSHTHDTHRRTRDKQVPGKTVVEQDFNVRGKGGRQETKTIPNHRNGHPKGKVPRHFNDTNGGHHIY